MQLLFEDIDRYIGFIAQAAEDLTALRMSIDIVWLNQAARNGKDFAGFIRAVSAVD